MEPTESKSRELLKIHRNLGHPQPRELARALRNAGAKRHMRIMFQTNYEKTGSFTKEHESQSNG
eukprot:4135140-Karenia_brevis.AAC.1